MLDLVYLDKSNYFHFTRKRTIFKLLYEKITNITHQIITKIPQQLIEKLQFDCGTLVLCTWLSSPWTSLYMDGTAIFDLPT
jgi:hypothetical protein